MTKQAKEQMEAEFKSLIEKDRDIMNSNPADELTKALKYLIIRYKEHTKDDSLWFDNFNYLAEINKIIDTINKLQEIFGSK